MKTVKITTHWTAEQAADIYLLLDELKSLIWQSYGEDIVTMHREIAHEQLQKEEEREECEKFNDDPLF